MTGDLPGGLHVRLIAPLARIQNMSGRLNIPCQSGATGAPFRQKTPGVFSSFLAQPFIRPGNLHGESNVAQLDEDVLMRTIAAMLPDA